MTVSSMRTVRGFPEPRFYNFLVPSTVEDQEGRREVVKQNFFKNTIPGDRREQMGSLTAQAEEAMCTLLAHTAVYIPPVPPSPLTVA